MAEPTLQEIFGTNAVQTADTLAISKADLPGLTASAANRAESLLVGILLKIKTSLSKTSFDSNLDQSVYIDSGYPAFTFRGSDNASYRVDQLTVNLAKLDTSGTIDPDDY